MHRCVGHLPPAAPPRSSSLTARGMLGLLSPRFGMVPWRRPRAPPARVTGPSLSGRWPSREYHPSLEPDVSLRRGGDGAGQGAGMYEDTAIVQFFQSRRGLSACEAATPSQYAADRLFWVATETATSHWLLGPTAFIHWSVIKLSACPHIARQTRLLSSESQRGAGQPHQRGLEGGGGVVPFRDLYLGESAPIRPFSTERSS